MNTKLIPSPALSTPLLDSPLLPIEDYRCLIFYVISNGVAC